MMKCYEFKVNPVAKPRMTRSDAWKGRKAVQKYWKFKDELRRLAEEQRFELPDAYEILFYIKMPESWSEKKKKEMEGGCHQQKPDLDNLVKAVNDCLKEKDQTVYDIRAIKKWGYIGYIHFHFSD